MPRAEAGTPKAIANKMKSKGLQRLRWYCQVCEQQMRDENGFKCHTQTEGHVRRMLLVAENPNKAITNFSKEFERDFIQLLRTTHGTKPIQVNHFYNQYIQNKEHVHMNATQWKSLTEFAKYLSREGICRVEETEKGLHISWIDNSPEALRRQDAIRKKERMDKGDEAREKQMIQEQIERAQRAKRVDEENEGPRELSRANGEKITLDFSAPKSATSKLPTPPKTSDYEDGDEHSSSEVKVATPPVDVGNESRPNPQPNLKMSLGSVQAKPKNVFASKKNPLASSKTAPILQPKKVSEAERIMKEELERKRALEAKGVDNFNRKRQKMS